MYDSNPPFKVCRGCGLPEPIWKQDGDKKRDGDFCTNDCFEKWNEKIKVLTKKTERILTEAFKKIRSR